MAKKNRKISEYSKHPDVAWEARRDYYEYNGIRDSRVGWQKRLGLSPNGFGNRLKLFKEGKITKDQLFRPASDDPHLRVHTKYELKMPRSEYIKSRRDAVRKIWEVRERCPANHTIRVWETVFEALKNIKPKTQSWSQFFIEKLNLKVKVPDAAKYSNF